MTRQLRAGIYTQFPCSCSSDASVDPGEDWLKLPGPELFRDLVLTKYDELFRAGQLEDLQMLAHDRICCIAPALALGLELDGSPLPLPGPGSGAGRRRRMQV